MLVLWVPPLLERFLERGSDDLYLTDEVDFYFSLELDLTALVVVGIFVVGLVFSFFAVYGLVALFDPPFTLLCL